MVVGASALIATSAFANISIKGDSLFRVSNKTTGAGDTASSLNKNEQRVRLHVVGKAGKTSMHMTIRSEGASRAGRVQQGGSMSGDDAKTGASVDQLYIKTSIRKVNIQAGDWWWTTGFGLVQKGKGTGDRIQLSGMVNGWKVIGGYNTNNTAKGSDRKVGINDPANISGSAPTKGKVGVFYLVAKGKIKGWNVGFKHTVDTNITEKATKLLSYTITKDGEFVINSKDKGTEVHNNSLFDITVKGSVKGIHIATEYFKSSIADSRANAFLLHVNKKIKGINLHFATAYYGSLVGNIYGQNSKFSPLGVSILGSANGVNGGLALGNVSANFDERKDTSIIAFRADFKAKGMDIKVALGQFNANQKSQAYVDGLKAGGKTGTKVDQCKITAFCDQSSTFLDLGVSYPLSKGATLKGTYGSWAGQTSMGAKISMKF